MTYNAIEAAANLSALNKLDYDNPVDTARLRKSAIIVAVDPEDSVVTTISFHDRSVKDVPSSETV